MLTRREHRQAVGQAAGTHRDALDAERTGWAGDRAVLRRGRSGHRTILKAERDRLIAARNEHRVALRKNRWLLALVDLLEARRRPAA